MTERTTVRLPPDLLRRAKRKAAAEGRTLTALIADGLRLVTAERRGPAGPRRVMPRLSKARGGTLPGVDLADSAALQELDDVQAIRRLREPG
jgi:hypothetical protein